MNNKICVTGDFGSMLITTHVSPQKSCEYRQRDELVLGYSESTKRGLFRKKTVQRPVTLSATEILQHVAVYAEVGLRADYWLMDKARQAIQFGWAVLYLDFMWSQWSLSTWNPMIIPSAVQSQMAPNDNLADLLTGHQTAYFRADNATVPALAHVVTNIMVTASDLRERPNTIIILNEMPADDASMEAVNKMLFQCHAAQIGLILRFQERQKTDFYAMLDENIRTTVEFPRSLGVSNIFPPCDKLGLKKLDQQKTGKNSPVHAMG